MELKTYSFDQTGCELAGMEHRGKNWPVVYLIHNNSEIYVGETNSFQNRFKQHLDNDERTSLTTISFVDDDEFNKSAVLDIEQNLIRLCSADGKFRLQNKNAGQSGMHDYFQRNEYEKKIPIIWNLLNKEKLTIHSYEELVNSNLFKYSPYTAPTDEQNEVCFQVLEQILESLQNNQNATSIVYGSAGTGKTVVAINIVHTLINMKLMNIDVEDDENDKWKKLIAEWKKYVSEKKLPKIAFVVPMQTLRETLGQVFVDVGGDSLGNVVISPNDVVKDDYDVVVVDESHRLRKRKNLTNYAIFDENCRKMGMDKNTANELDWIVKKSRHRVLFYDPAQSVKSSDVSKDEYENSIKETNKKTFLLSSQMRCRGGEHYIDYVKSVFNLSCYEKKQVLNYEIKVYNDDLEMVNDIKKKDNAVGLCRVVAGFAWEWKTKKMSQTQKQEYFDIEINGHEYLWNDFNAKNWILSPNAVNEIGCIHTSQGYDLNYVGIIFGREIEWNESQNQFDINLDLYFDKKVKDATPKDKVEEYIINAYKVMMTRGIKGCYMYACNPGMQKFLKKWF